VLFQVYGANAEGRLGRVQPVTVRMLWRAHCQPAVALFQPQLERLFEKAAALLAADVLLLHQAPGPGHAHLQQLAVRVVRQRRNNTAGVATFVCAPTRGPRQVTPPSMPADLSLAMPTTFGPKLFEITAMHTVSTSCKVKVKDTGDLLLFRHWLFEELGPPTCGL
jgi:hypothetical protein